ncbi:MAG: S1 RNA-binding domain-containing protein, partial [Pseudomonadota bacterium]|nr:S1 RNA-binding domain-containing protein [Pseudomonadota bacterium]
TVRSVTDFGIFVGLTEEIDGLVHMSDISWEKSGEDALSEYKKGDTVKAVVLSADADKERVSLGIKQMGEDPMKAVSGAFKKGATVTGKVTEADDKGITLDIGGEMPGFIKRADVAREKAEQTPENFNAGDEVSAKVLSVSARDRRVNLSIKALQIDEEKAAVAEYASSSEGAATLGDALGAALAGAKTDEEKPAKKTAAKKSTKKSAE